MPDVYNRDHRKKYVQGIASPKASTIRVSEDSEDEISFARPSRNRMRIRKYTVLRSRSPSLSSSSLDLNQLDDKVYYPYDPNLTEAEMKALYMKRHCGRKRIIEKGERRHLIEH